MKKEKKNNFMKESLAANEKKAHKLDHGAIYFFFHASLVDPIVTVLQLSFSFSFRFDRSIFFLQTPQDLVHVKTLSSNGIK